MYERAASGTFIGSFLKDMWRVLIDVEVALKATKSLFYQTKIGRKNIFT